MKTGFKQLHILVLIIIISVFICGNNAFSANISKTVQKTVNKEISNHIYEGRRYYNLKQYNLAIYEWELALSLDPDNKKIKKYINNAQGRLQKMTKIPADLISVVAPLKEAQRVLTLKECIDIAVKNSHQLKIAEKQILLSKSRIMEARRNLFPKLSLGFEESRGRIQGRRYYGKKEFVVLPYEEFVALQEALADAEDVLDLRAAKRDEADRPGISLAEVKKKLF